MTKQLDLFGAAQMLGKKGGQSKTPAKQQASQNNGKLGGRPISVNINPDGVSITGCHIIYAPAGQAAEYAPLATNPYRGCGHKCSYCYVPDVLRIPRSTFDSGAEPRTNFLDQLTKDARKYQLAEITEQVMLSFTTDPFNPYNTSLTRPTIETLIQHGLSFCTLTKGGSRSIPFIDLFRPTRDAFASTLTSLDDTFSLKWERGAALPKDRIDTLRKFHNAGIFTWVSLEPTLSTEASLQIIQETHEFVDHYKIGRANYLPMTNTTDWKEYTHQVIELCARLNVNHYIKKDLQKYLPSGYHNPLRLPQHH
jgi:DNA repair photolyase